MELSLGTIIKIILGVLVIGAVAYGLYRFFSNNVIGSFSDMGLNGSVNFILALF
jgi:hypothetical protein